MKITVPEWNSIGLRNPDGSSLPQGENVLDDEEGCFATIGTWGHGSLHSTRRESSYGGAGWAGAIYFDPNHRTGCHLLLILPYDDVQSYGKRRRRYKTFEALAKSWLRHDPDMAVGTYKDERKP